MKEFLTLLVPVLLLLGAAVVLMGVKVLFVKGGRFPVSHVDGNPELARRGIHCAHHEDAAAAGRYPARDGRTRSGATDYSSQDKTYKTTIHNN